MSYEYIHKEPSKYINLSICGEPRYEDIETENDEEKIKNTIFAILIHEKDNTKIEDVINVYNNLPIDFINGNSKECEINFLN